MFKSEPIVGEDAVKSYIASLAGGFPVPTATDAPPMDNVISEVVEAAPEATMSEDVGGVGAGAPIEEAVAAIESVGPIDESVPGVLETAEVIVDGSESGASDAPAAEPDAYEESAEHIVEADTPEAFEDVADDYEGVPEADVIDELEDVED